MSAPKRVGGGKGQEQETLKGVWGQEWGTMGGKGKVRGVDTLAGAGDSACGQTMGMVSYQGRNCE